jgi:hypothetical protein
VGLQASATKWSCVIAIFKEREAFLKASYVVSPTSLALRHELMSR